MKHIIEAWTHKYKKSIDCSNPKGFSQKAHCAGRKKREDFNLKDFFNQTNEKIDIYLINTYNE